MENLRNQSFPLKTELDWEAKAEQSLKGKTVESLHSKTYENIILKPLYSRRGEQAAPDYPGGSDFRRGIYPLGYVTNDWKVAQRISYQTVEELEDMLLQAVEKGQTALSFEVSRELAEEDVLSGLTVLSSKYPFAINTKGFQSAFLSKLVNLGNVTGYIANDPISLFAESGMISEEFIQTWVKDVLLANVRVPNLRTVLIDTTPYHNGGANAVQELAIAIAEGVYYLQQLIENGMEIETALSKMVFQFSIGSHFFMEVAKVRAARILWNKVTKVYGASSTSQGMIIAAETSGFTKAIFDPHVNLLRAGNEAFAAVLGGVQYLHVIPFDAVTGSSPFSERIARNIQLILKEEAHLKKVNDPAGGSWYVEELTVQLAEKAWEMFQRMEANGGILDVLQSNWLQNEIASVYEKRNKDIQTRRQSIVGTNVYANIAETASSEKLKTVDSHFTNGIEIDAIPQKRLAEPFEELRNRAKKLKETPTVGVICLGEFKQYKARLDFMKGFLAAGAIKTAESDTIFGLEDALDFVSSLTSKHICFCSTNEKYEMFGHELLFNLKAKFPNRTFYLAGLPEKEKQDQWVKEGLTEFIHLKSNCYETLSSILAEMEVAASEETKA